MEQGKYVSRSVYQKVCEENKKLKSDIWTLVMKAVTWDSVAVRMKWEKKFKEDKELSEMLRDFAIQYVKDNPDSIPAKIAKEFPPQK